MILAPKRLWRGLYRRQCNSSRVARESGPAHGYGAREMDPLDGVMKKCTLCIDRIYNQNLAEEERVPACVSVCPVSARHFGDFADPESAVSRLVAERGTVELLPEMGYRPANAYLAPRARPAEAAPAAALPDWMDRARVEYTMTRVAVLLVSMSEKEVPAFVKALDGTKEARARAATMAAWLEELSRQHEARAKLARDAAGRLRDVSERL